jgi:hypothetical protein
MFKKIIAWIVGVIVTLLVLGVIGLGLYRAFFLTWVENYQAAYEYNTKTGHITVIDRSGYVPCVPFYRIVHTVDTRPIQVAINANNRILNAKLVQFDMKGLELFISWHGRKDYEFDAAMSATNITTGSFEDILRSYAYDGTGTRYPFLKILKELKPESAAPTAVANTQTVSSDSTKTK